MASEAYDDAGGETGGETGGPDTGGDVTTRTFKVGEEGVLVEETDNGDGTYTYAVTVADTDVPLGDGVWAIGTTDLAGNDRAYSDSLSGAWTYDAFADSSELPDGVFIIETHADDGADLAVEVGSGS